MKKSESRFGVSERIAWFNVTMPQRCIHVTTVPAMLAEVGGSQAELARRLGAERATIRKYKNDPDAEHHAIVNGILFVQRRGASGSKKGSNHAETS